MKKIFSIIIVILIIVSLSSNVVGALDYSDLRPTYTDTSDYWRYINSSSDTDDELQKRSNCYGYAIRLHYNGDLDLDGIFNACGQLPGEFANRSSSGITFDELYDNYNYSTLSIFTKVMQDCQELGYTVTALKTCTSTTYIPPSASESPDKRLVVVLGKSANKLDFHFLIQGNDNTWSQKMGDAPAQNTCVRHTSIVLNNTNISQHMRCSSDQSDYGTTAIFFYLDGPGTTDMSHYLDPVSYSESYQTIVRQYEGHGNSPNKFECAGGALISSEPLSVTSSILKTGYINHLNDIDYFIFDVSNTRNYTITIYTSTEYRIRMRYADVTNISANSSPSFGNIYATLDTGQTSTSVNLTAGRRYCLMIYSTNQTVYESERYYVISIT